MTVVTNEEELNLIEKALIKKKYDNVDTSLNEVEGDEQELVTKAIEKKNKEQGFFNDNDKVLVVHTGGLQGIKGMNSFLERKKLPLII